MKASTTANVSYYGLELGEIVARSVHSFRYDSQDKIIVQKSKYHLPKF